MVLAIGSLAFAAAPASLAKADHLDPLLVEQGRQIFFNETFDGNGRTCATCHRAEDNFGLTPAFIAGLPPGDPLFVAETNPNLAMDFENPFLMRNFGLIVENNDGFGDLANDFNLRGIPHLLAMNVSVASAAGSRTGWSGDGAPGDGSLRSFAIGAVTQHFPKTLNRVPGVDFRLPTAAELDALEAFQLSLGRHDDLQLPLPLTGIIPARGQEIFMDNTLGKCNACHFNAGANGDPAIFGPGAGNLNFDTGVEVLPDQPADLTGELVPPDDGFGTPGDGTFNTPSVVEAADTGPFFHNNSVETIEGAVGFYNGAAFNNSPAGQLLTAATGSGIDLDGTQVVAVAAFLRVINVLENIRTSRAYLITSLSLSDNLRVEELLGFTIEETLDAIIVLKGGALNPEAIPKLLHVEEQLVVARVLFDIPFLRNPVIREAIAELDEVRRQLVSETAVAATSP
jgi:mono/diheme cytochrome c family protein